VRLGKGNKERKRRRKWRKYLDSESEVLEHSRSASIFEREIIEFQLPLHCRGKKVRLQLGSERSGEREGMREREKEGGGRGEGK